MTWIEEHLCSLSLDRKPVWRRLGHCEAVTWSHGFHDKGSSMRVQQALASCRIMTFSIEENSKVKPEHFYEEKAAGGS